MHTNRKQYLFEAFEAEWGAQFRRVPAILRFLASYPQAMLITGRLITEGLEESQREWVSLVERFDHPAESTFFQKHWVPVNVDDYEYFIDLSVDSFVLFKIDFLMMEPDRWYRTDCEPDIRDFMLLTSDPDTDILKLRKLYKARAGNLMRHLMDQRTRVKSRISLPLEPLTREEVFSDAESPGPTWHIHGNRLVIQGVTVLALGLLPHFLETRSVMVRTKNYRHAFRNTETNTLKITLLRLRNKGHKNVLAWKGIFLESMPKNTTLDYNNPCRIVGYTGYTDNTFYLTHCNRLVLNHMIGKLAQLEKSG